MKKFHFILLALLWSSITSCETVVELDVPREDTRLVVNSFFGPDTTFAMSLSQSEFILDEQNFGTVSGADATVMDDEGNTLGALEEQQPGIYTSDIKPQAGKSYRLEVSKPGYETVAAVNQLPADSARISKYKIKRYEGGYSAASLSIWIDDPQDKDYYELYGRAKTTVYSESDTSTRVNTLSFSTDDPIFTDFDEDNDRFNGRYLLFDDVLFDGQTRRITLDTSFRYVYCNPSSECEIETEVTLYLRKTSKAYFKYKETSRLQNELSGNPFAEPVPVYNNIENGFGIFAGYNVSTYPLEIPEFNQP